MLYFYPLMALLKHHYFWDYYNNFNFISIFYFIYFHLGNACSNSTIKDTCLKMNKLKHLIFNNSLIRTVNNHSLCMSLLFICAYAFMIYYGLVSTQCTIVKKALKNLILLFLNLTLEFLSLCIQFSLLWMSRVLTQQACQELLTIIRLLENLFCIFF